MPSASPLSGPVDVASSAAADSLCELCEKVRARVACQQCDMDALCETCDTDLHKTSKLHHHRRTYLDTGDVVPPIGDFAAAAVGAAAASAVPTGLVASAAATSNPHARAHALAFAPTFSLISSGAGPMRGSLRPRGAARPGSGGLGSIYEHGAKEQQQQHQSSRSMDSVPSLDASLAVSSSATVAASSSDATAAAVAATPTDESDQFAKACDACGAERASWYCSSCQRFSCTECDRATHKSSNAKHHLRSPYPPVFGRAAAAPTPLKGSLDDTQEAAKGKYQDILREASAEAAVPPLSQSPPVAALISPKSDSPVAAVAAAMGSPSLSAPQAIPLLSPSLFSLGSASHTLTPGGGRNTRAMSVMAPSGGGRSLFPLPIRSAAGATATSAATPSEPSKPSNALCDICEDSKASVYCAECDMNLCVSNQCDEELHAPMKMRAHHRKPINAISFMDQVKPNEARATPNDTVNATQGGGSVTLAATSAPTTKSATPPPAETGTPALALAVNETAAVPSAPVTLFSPLSGAARIPLPAASGLPRPSMSLLSKSPPVSLPMRPRASSVMIKNPMPLSRAGAAGGAAQAVNLLGLLPVSRIGSVQVSPEATARTARGSRLCEICEAHPAAVYCAACPMYLCISGGCDAQLHHPVKMSHHFRSAIPRPRCTICEENEGDVWCFECKKHFCTADACDEDYHRPAKMAAHRRGRVTELHRVEAATPATTATMAAADTDSDQKPEAKGNGTTVAEEIASASENLAHKMEASAPAPAPVPVPVPAVAPVAAASSPALAPAPTPTPAPARAPTPVAPIVTPAASTTSAPTASIPPPAAVLSSPSPVLAPSPALAPVSAPALPPAPAPAPAVAPAPAAAAAAPTRPRPVKPRSLFVVCDSCDTAIATRICDTCKLDRSSQCHFYCAACEARTHDDDDRRRHRRREITKADTDDGASGGAVHQTGDQANAGPPAPANPLLTASRAPGSDVSAALRLATDSPIHSARPSILLPSHMPSQSPGRRIVASSPRLVPTRPMCDRCSSRAADLCCDDCELNLDVACFAELHKSTSAKLHPRREIIESDDHARQATIRARTPRAARLLAQALAPHTVRSAAPTPTKGSSARVQPPLLTPSAVPSTSSSFRVGAIVPPLDFSSPHLAIAGPVELRANDDGDAIGDISSDDDDHADDGEIGSGLSVRPPPHPLPSAAAVAAAAPTDQTRPTNGTANATSSPSPPLSSFESALMARVALLERHLQESVQLKSSRIHSARLQRATSDSERRLQTDSGGMTLSRAQVDGALSGVGASPSPPPLRPISIGSPMPFGGPIITSASHTAATVEDSPAAMAAIRIELNDARSQLQQFQSLAQVLTMQLQHQQQAVAIIQMQQQQQQQHLSPTRNIFSGAALTAPLFGVNPLASPLHAQSTFFPSTPTVAPFGSTHFAAAAAAAAGATNTIASAHVGTDAASTRRELSEPMQKEIVQLISDTVQATIKQHQSQSPAQPPSHPSHPPAHPPSHPPAHPPSHPPSQPPPPPADTPTGPVSDLTSTSDFHVSHASPPSGADSDVESVRGGASSAASAVSSPADSQRDESRPASQPADSRRERPTSAVASHDAVGTRIAHRSSKSASRARSPPRGKPPRVHSATDARSGGSGGNSNGNGAPPRHHSTAHRPPAALFHKPLHTDSRRVPSRHHSVDHLPTGRSSLDSDREWPLDVDTRSDTNSDATITPAWTADESTTSRWSTDRSTASEDRDRDTTNRRRQAQHERAAATGPDGTRHVRRIPALAIDRHLLSSSPIRHSGAHRSESSQVVPPPHRELRARTLHRSHRSIPPSAAQSRSPSPANAAVVFLGATRRDAGRSNGVADLPLTTDIDSHRMSEEEGGDDDDDEDELESFPSSPSRAMIISARTVSAATSSLIARYREEAVAAMAAVADEEHTLLAGVARDTPLARALTTDLTDLPATDPLISSLSPTTVGGVSASKRRARELHRQAELSQQLAIERQHRATDHRRITDLHHQLQRLQHHIEYQQTSSEWAWQQERERQERRQAARAQEETEVRQRAMRAQHEYERQRYGTVVPLDVPRRLRTSATAPSLSTVSHTHSHPTQRAVAVAVADVAVGRADDDFDSDPTPRTLNKLMQAQIYADTIRQREKRYDSPPVPPHPEWSARRHQWEAAIGAADDGDSEDTWKVPPPALVPVVVPKLTTLIAASSRRSASANASSVQPPIATPSDASRPTGSVVHSRGVTPRSPHHHRHARTHSSIASLESPTRAHSHSHSHAHAPIAALSSPASLAAATVSTSLHHRAASLGAIRRGDESGADSATHTDDDSHRFGSLTGGRPQRRLAPLTIDRAGPTVTATRDRRHDGHAEAAADGGAGEHTRRSMEKRTPGAIQQTGSR